MDPGGGRADILDKIRTILAQLDEAELIEDIRLTSFNLHPLKGSVQGLYSVKVRSNWRIIFTVADGNAGDVELVDYH